MNDEQLRDLANQVIAAVQTYRDSETHEDVVENGWTLANLAEDLAGYLL